MVLRSPQERIPLSPPPSIRTSAQASSASLFSLEGFSQSKLGAFCYRSGSKGNLLSSSFYLFLSFPFSIPSFFFLPRIHPPICVQASPSPGLWLVAKCAKLNPGWAGPALLEFDPIREPLTMTTGQSWLWVLFHLTCRSPVRQSG